MKAPQGWLPLAVQLRAVFWLGVVLLIDASGPVLLIAAGFATAVDMWLRTIRSRSQFSADALAAVHPRLPVAFLLFGLMVVVNVLFQSMFVDAESSPYLLNIVVTHLCLLFWAYITAPSDRLVISAIHKWSMIFICVLSGLLFVQILWRENFGTYLDFRLLLTGEASRSASEEFDDGARPTSLFAEPSNHAIAVFLLAFVHSVCGRRSFWLALVAMASCLLTNSSMGALLALYLLIDEGVRHIHVQPGRLLNSLLLLLGGVVVVLGLAYVLDASDIIALAYERVIAPESPYDPIAVRLYVPLRIAEFSVFQHLLGSGIANYASFPEGLTLNDSSLILAAYFQMGIAGLVLLWAPVRAYAKNHSWRLALMLLALYVTKLGLLMPAFWALAALAQGRPHLSSNRVNRKRVKASLLSSRRGNPPAAARAS
jgi:hypothetical protein